MHFVLTADDAPLPAVFFADALLLFFEVTLVLVLMFILLWPQSYDESKVKKIQGYLIDPATTASYYYSYRLTVFGYFWKFIDMDQLTFYTAEWCPDCLAARRVLDERGLEYNVVDIDGNPEAVEVIVAARGKRVVPTLEYKGRFMDGNHFDREKFERELEQLLAR